MAIELSPGQKLAAVLRKNGLVSKDWQQLSASEQHACERAFEDLDESMGISEGELALEHLAKIRDAQDIAAIDGEEGFVVSYRGVRIDKVDSFVLHFDANADRYIAPTVFMRLAASDDPKRRELLDQIERDDSGRRRITIAIEDGNGRCLPKTESIPIPRAPIDRACNRHDDCDAADAKARKAGRSTPDHCHDENCEECFGQ